MCPDGDGLISAALDARDKGDVDFPALAGPVGLDQQWQRQHIAGAKGLLLFG